MSAVLQPPHDPAAREAQLHAMTTDWLDTVASVEQSAYEHPWTIGNFSDSLKAGYHARLLTGGAPSEGQLIGYFVAMQGVDEVHLLNITIAPEHQGQGWAWVCLDALALWARGQAAQWLWLEVRVSNVRAVKVYAAHGYKRVGQRKDYYPAAGGQREDAIVMSQKL